MGGASKGGGPVVGSPVEEVATKLGILPRVSANWRHFCGVGPVWSGVGPVFGLGNVGGRWPMAWESRSGGLVGWLGTLGCVRIEGSMNRLRAIFFSQNRLWLERKGSGWFWFRV
ncbi:hypothetical protein Adt_19015 [Abeliophyllum distichum]|uniref:Uncharacterized protein n=1 Tax=Abeliophyllum distichum TaxID=126358 RepID=A0ABD1TL08_9LAMI